MHKILRFLCTLTALCSINGVLYAECLGEYKRSYYPHWGASENYADIRQEVIAEAVVSGLKVDNGRVVAGLWFDKMTGRLYQIEDVKPDVDHIVSLKFAHEAGMKCASRELRTKFANDKRHLWVVHPTANRRKGARVSTFLMPNQGYCKEYYHAIAIMFIDYPLNQKRWHRKAFYKYKQLCGKHSKGILLDRKWWEF